MASDQSANLALPYLAAAQAQKHVTHNEALRRLDAYVQLALESVTMVEPPAAPAEGARWFVPAGAAGAFAGQEGKVAAYEAGAFDFLPVPGDALAYIRDEARFSRFDGVDWVAPFAVGDAGPGAPLVLESVTATAPPAAPVDGGRWFVPAGGSGAFSGQAGSLATYAAGAFTFGSLMLGTLAFIRDQWRLALYDGGAFVSPLAARPQRAAIEADVLEEDLVLSGASVDTAIAIPARAIVLGVSTRTLSEVTGAASYDCGISGESSKFGGSLGIALGASNSGVIGPTAFYAATPVRLTANGGVFTGGRVRVSIHLLRCPVSVFPGLEPAWWTGGAYRLDAAVPVLAADFSRERYALNGAHASSTSVVQRSGAAKAVVSASGVRMLAPANALAFDHAGGRRRLVLEGTSTNLFIGSAAPTAAQGVTVTAQPYTVAFEGTGSVAIGGTHAHTIAGAGTNARVSYTFTPTAGTLTLTPSGDVRKVQLEANGIATSHIETTTAAVTRVTDLCPLSSAAVALLGTAACTLAWRGAVRSGASAQRIMGLSGTSYLMRGSSSGTGWLLVTPMAQGDAFAVSGAPSIPGEFGVVMGWDGDGTIASINDAAPTTTTTPAAGSVAAAYLGSSSGMTAGARHEIDELLVWPLKGSAPEVQSQARAWA